MAVFFMPGTFYDSSTRRAGRASSSSSPVHLFRQKMRSVCCVFADWTRFEEKNVTSGRKKTPKAAGACNSQVSKKNTCSVRKKTLEAAAGHNTLVLSKTHFLVAWLMSVQCMDRTRRRTEIPSPERSPQRGQSPEPAAPLYGATRSVASFLVEESQSSGLFGLSGPHTHAPFWLKLIVFFQNLGAMPRSYLQCSEGKKRVF